MIKYISSTTHFINPQNWFSQAIHEAITKRVNPQLLKLCFLRIACGNVKCA